jgi:hypothetical protein
MKGLLLSPEEICIRVCGEAYCQQEEMKFPCERFESYEKVTQVQHLKTLNGILEIVDELVNEWCRCTLPDNIKISFSSYLRQHLQIEPPKNKE